MGWTGMDKPDNVSDWMKRQLTWESGGAKNTCLDVAIVQRQTGYAAVETVHEDGTREIWAAVFALHFFPRAQHGETFSYKDMTEHMGPNEVDCPKRILDRLTPTDSQYANEWRAKCRERLARRDANRVADGAYVRFANRMHFKVNTWGDEREADRDTFRIEVRGRRVAFMAIDDDGRDDFRCRISAWRDKEFTKLEGDDIPRPPQPEPRP